MGILPVVARRKVAQYWSDFKDAFSLQCIASWIFLYFACLSPIITFGGLLGQATGNNIAAMESLMSGFLCGVIYGLFSGQPLTILGSTGPVLVFESIVYEFCLETMEVETMEMKFMRSMLAFMKRNRIKNEVIWERVGLYGVCEIVEEAGLRLSGHVIRIENKRIPKRMMETMQRDWDYLPFRLWIGVWIGIILLIMVAIDASAFVCYITRFTEENFATLIAFIFIYKFLTLATSDTLSQSVVCLSIEVKAPKFDSRHDRKFIIDEIYDRPSKPAVENVLHIGRDFPINTSGSKKLDYNCSCEPVDGISYDGSIAWSALGKDECLISNGTLVGEGCSTPLYVPDVFLMSIVLFLGTFIISVELKDFKNALFFPSKVVCDSRTKSRFFHTVIRLVPKHLTITMCLLIHFPPRTHYQVPAEFKPTLSTRGWVVAPFGRNPFWTAIIAVVPALLGTILIFMDQQITAVIVNRKEFKLKAEQNILMVPQIGYACIRTMRPLKQKGCGYHLDLFVLANLIIICSIMGLPWFVAATVLSINHVNSLKVESECAAPGEKPQFLGVSNGTESSGGLSYPCFMFVFPSREQRVTHILIFLMMGLSVVLTPVLRHIPMAVLYGVFLYMGIASLKGLQFFDRLLIFFMPAKYQPDFLFLRKVPIRRVHLFTVIQLACLIALWLIKSFSSTSILFPLMLVVMIGIRKSLDLIFSQRDLKILDDVMPDTKYHDDDSEEDGKQADLESGDNLKIPLANGNFIKIPMASINITEEVNKTGLWKHVNEGHINGKANTKKSQNKNSLKTKKRGSKKDAISDDEQTKLSVTNEEEEEVVKLKGWIKRDSFAILEELESDIRKIEELESKAWHTDFTTLPGTEEEKTDNETTVIVRTHGMNVSFISSSKTHKKKSCAIINNGQLNDTAILATWSLQQKRCDQVARMSSNVIYMGDPKSILFATKSLSPSKRMGASTGGRSSAMRNDGAGEDGIGDEGRRTTTSLGIGPGFLLLGDRGEEESLICDALRLPPLR
uniref:Bicarbonate transporter-like transmembrane domain-containing protein n=1 Tax=Timema cristinae TaxID=61476 RepID=A0A7R9GRR1_TIMCR|nr:unnamed protein product [Timema cristinae]